MDVRNLAIVFGSVIFGEDELPKNSDVLTISAWKVSLIAITYPAMLTGDFASGFRYGGSDI